MAHFVLRLEGRKMKCWDCNSEATKTRNLSVPRKMYGELIYSETVPNTKQRCYCDDCFRKHIAEMQEEDRLYVKLKKKRMYEAAVDKLEHQNISFVEYEEAIKAVGEYVIENPDKFDSSYEMLAAIILIQNHIHCKMQHKIGKYQVDFLLPEEKVVLEIDGEQHKNQKTYDNQRDAFIKKQLGSEWNIIRIPTNLLDQHADRLWEAIEKVIDHRENKKIYYK